MSHDADRGGRYGSLAPESELESLRRSPELRGPNEPLDDHDHSNDHFALIYESDEELFTAAVPFIRQGLEQNEQCIYVLDERTKGDVLEALQAGGIDVEAALDSGALVFTTVQETYLRTKPFDPEEMISFYAETIDRALDEYEGLRVIAGMNWIDDVSFEAFLEYEGRVNGLFEETDSMALCAYNREQLPAAVIRDIIRTHPHLIHNGTVCHNYYYIPPEDLFGSDQPTTDVDRMLGMIHERTATQNQLEDRQRYLRRQNEIIASSDRPFEEKLQALFELGCERFDLDLGGMARIDTEDDCFRVEYVSDDHEYFAPGVEFPLSEPYCTAADSNATGIVTALNAEGSDDSHVFQDGGIESYLGLYLPVEGGTDRTFFFVGAQPRAADFSTDDREFIRSMGQWVNQELERRQRERFLRESHAITSDPALSFEEKLERLLHVGCEWFDVEMAGLNYLPTWDGKFRLEKGIGLGVESEDDPLWTDPDEACFCRQTITEDEPVGRIDVRGTDWADDSIYQEFGLTCYFGTKVMSGSTPYGTLWFGSTDPRERPFSDTERTFLELMGQWISYEIERREHQQSQQALYDIAADPNRSFEEKLQAVFDLGCQRFDMELGGIAIAEPETDHFEVEFTNGDQEYLVPGEEYPLSETYCRVPAYDGGTQAITAPERKGFEGQLCYDQFGVRAYLGTYLEFDDAANRTFWFVSTDPRADGFSEAEHTFHHLMGQWVQHELEQRQYKQELEETVAQLQQSNDRLQEFAYAASHDLQEPLRMVSTYLQHLENQYMDELDADAQEYIEFAVDGADRMRAMVDGLLDYARVEQADVEFEPVDCDAVFDRVMDDLQVRIDDADAEIAVESLPTVSGDADQLQQLFSNLVSNAIKYNESDPPRVEITADQRADHWEFAVTDNGIGIDPAGTDRIFEVFKRLHSGDTYPGTGVGLALCQEIVERHGGEIRVESTPGEGSTFYVRLPHSAGC